MRAGALFAAEASVRTGLLAAKLIAFAEETCRAPAGDATVSAHAIVVRMDNRYRTKFSPHGSGCTLALSCGHIQPGDNLVLMILRWTCGAAAILAIVLAGNAAGKDKSPALSTREIYEISLSRTSGYLLTAHGRTVIEAHSGCGGTHTVQ